MKATTTIPTQDEVNSIPNKNWIAWLKAEYNIDCGEPGFIEVITDKEEMNEEHQKYDYILNFKTFCTKLNQTYCDVTPEQYEKIKSGYYNKKNKNRKSDYKKMIAFMGYKSKYPNSERDKDRIFFKKIDESIKYDDWENEHWIWLDSSDVSFRPDKNWEHLNKVVEHIESMPSTLETSIKYNKGYEFPYEFEICLKGNLKKSGYIDGKSRISKIDAVYDGVMNYINWRLSLIKKNPNK